MSFQLPSPEIAVGYTLFAGLVALTAHLLRRTREIDRRRDLLADAEMQLARDREKLANADLARLETEIEKLRNELWRTREGLGQ